MKQGRFRGDLFARLGHVVTIPPLRERTGDIPLLIRHFLGRCGKALPSKVFADETMELLLRHSWPFNVRELEQVVERTVCLVDRDVVLPADLPDYIRREASEAEPLPEEVGPSEPDEFPTLRQVVREAEREHLTRALAQAKGNKRRAIQLLGISSDTFYRRIRDCGLD